MISQIRNEESSGNKELNQLLNLEEQYSLVANKKQKYLEKLKKLEERENQISKEIEMLKRNSFEKSKNEENKNENVKNVKTKQKFFYFYF